MSYSRHLPKAPAEPYDEYRCDTCGKTADHLSESWSTISISRFEEREPQVLHFCLECRSIKQVWTGEGWKVPDVPTQ